MDASSNKMTAVYFSSNLFAEPCGVSIASLFENNKDFDKITVYIVEDKISEENKNRFDALAKQYGREIEFISMPDPKVFFDDERFTLSSLGHTFGRMIVGQLLPENVGKVLCMDSDMLVIDSLQELWTTDLKEYYLAGVDSAPGTAMMEKTLKIEPGTLYCNGGLFLINLDKVRKDKIERKYVQYIKDVFDSGDSLGAYEEEVMNKCCYPRVYRLNPRYNYMTVNIVMDYESFVKFRGAVNYYTKSEMENAQAKPAIIHAINTFYVRRRIWEKNSDSPYADEYIKYRKMTLWGTLPPIETKRTVKQIAMKNMWHIVPRSISFKLAAFVRNEIRPRLAKKRDDE